MQRHFIHCSFVELSSTLSEGVHEGIMLGSPVHPTGLQEGGQPDEPGPDQEVDSAQPVRGGIGQDQCHRS